MCKFLSSVLRQQKFKQRMDQCYSSVLFGKQKKIHPQGVRVGQPKRRQEKRGQRPSFGSSFYVFPPPPSLHMYLASQEGCLFQLRFSLWSSDFPLVYFHGFFPSLSFNHHHSGLLSPILTTHHFPLERWEAQFFGNGGIEISLATSCYRTFLKMLKNQ